MNLGIIVLFIFMMSSAAYADELIGNQTIRCGGRNLSILSINDFSAMELTDAKNRVHPVRSYGLGQGGADEWACIKFDKYYLVFRGNTTVRLSENEAIELNVHDVFDTVNERFTFDGKIGKYIDLLEHHRFKLAKKLYPKLDLIYHKARFEKFNFDLSDAQLLKDSGNLGNVRISVF